VSATTQDSVAGKFQTPKPKSEIGFGRTVTNLIAHGSTVSFPTQSASRVPHLSPELLQGTIPVPLSVNARVRGQNRSNHSPGQRPKINH
jgi:hypothetical protein